MARITWDETGNRFYETGVNKGVLFVRNVAGEYYSGVAWNGLIGITESPSGAEVTPLYADNIQYLSLAGPEEFGFSIEAYTYPDEFNQCLGNVGYEGGMEVSQQRRARFGLCYATILGNDTLGNDYGYKLHIIYGAMVSPSERAYSTINDSPEAITFSWEATTIPTSITLPIGSVLDLKPTSIITINSTKVLNLTGLRALEDILYGTENIEPRLPMPGEIFALLQEEDTNP